MFDWQLLVVSSVPRSDDDTCRTIAHGLGSEVAPSSTQAFNRIGWDY